MKGLSAHAAKRTPKPKAVARIEIKYTVGGEPRNFREVFALVHHINADITAARVRDRLDRGERDLTRLAASKLPAYRPKAMRGPKS